MISFIDGIFKSARCDLTAKADSSQFSKFTELGVRLNHMVDEIVYGFK